MEDVESAIVVDVDIAIVVDPVVVLGMSDEVDDVCSSKVSGVDVSPTVEDVISDEVDNVDIAIVVEPSWFLGCPMK